MNRVQRSRRKGARLPPRTLCCTRPGKWSNPFGLPARPTRDDLTKCLESYAGDLDWRFTLSTAWDRHLRLEWLQAYDHLACWCRLDRPCHVDIILDRFHAKFGTEVISLDPSTLLSMPKDTAELVAERGLLTSVPMAREVALPWPIL